MCVCVCVYIVVRLHLRVTKWLIFLRAGFFALPFLRIRGYILSFPKLKSHRLALKRQTSFLLFNFVKIWPFKTCILGIRLNVIT